MGFEVIGSRFAAKAPDPCTARSRTTSRNGAIVVGDAVPQWRDVAFEDVALRLTEDDRELVSVVGCHPFDDPFLPVVVGVNRLRRHTGVKTGDIIVTNSSTSFFPVAAGASVRAVYDGLGEVVASFSSD